MFSLSVIENYVLEIKARAEAIRRSCDYLSTINYSTDAPLNLTITISKICDFLKKAVVSMHQTATYADEEDIANTVKVYNYIDLLIKEIGSHVEYVEAARFERLPWSIIPSFHNLIKKLMYDVPDLQIMMRPQWNYNYSIDLTDLRKFYIEALSELQDFVPEINLEAQTLDRMKGSFFLITLPAVERKNILLHPLIGHEIGHLYVAKYIDECKRNKFSETIRPAIDNIVKKNNDNELLKEELFKHVITSKYLQDAQTYWERALEELLSDAVGAILFGPAALFSSFELSVQQGLDIQPSPERNYYPPWRMRLRTILKVLDNYGESFFPVTEGNIFEFKDKTDRVNNKYNEIKKITEMTKDLDKINDNEIAKIAYDQVSPDLEVAINFFLNTYKLSNNLIKKSELYRDKNLHQLIERLDNGITPNAIENCATDRQAAAMVEIINAAWFYKISLESVGKNPEAVEQRYKLKERMNNLTLKAIEYSEIEANYFAEDGKQKHGE